MSFQRYPKYKDSGVKWLGDVPEHWAVTPLKWLTDPERPIMYGIVLPGPDVGDGIPILKGGNVRPERMNLQAMARTTPGIEAPYARARLKGGDLVYSIRGSIGDCEPVPAELDGSNITQDVARVAVAEDVHAPWVRWALLASAIRDDLASGSLGAAVRGINIFDLKRARIPTPPRGEQIAIATFIDVEAAKIDSLASEAQRLIDLLKEKRQAVISRAVTKGLNPDVPMKDSSVEWLGDVPAHWSVAPLSSRYSVQLGKMLDSTKITGEHLRPYLRVFDVQWGAINTSDLPFMDFDEDSRDKFKLLPGDLLVNEGGSYPGRSALWHGAIDECYYQKALHRLRAHTCDQDSTRFLYYVMSSAAPQGLFVAGGNETTIEHLPAEKLRRYRFAFPPISEQVAIADHLDSDVARLDHLAAEAQRAIDLLQERRTALISAAVTGQIDVRGLSKSDAA
jgi:type I restriction enzyme, S subunit